MQKVVVKLLIGKRKAYVYSCLSRLDRGRVKADWWFNLESETEAMMC